MVANDKNSNTAFCDNCSYSSLKLLRNSINGIDLNFSCNDESDDILIKIKFNAKVEHFRVPYLNNLSILQQNNKTNFKTKSTVSFNKQLLQFLVFITSTVKFNLLIRPNKIYYK